MIDTKPLLIEIGTEELPPRALVTLAESFASEVMAGLDREDLAYGTGNWYATPRRLAIMIDALATVQQDREVVKRGPALKAAYDKENRPTRAAEGFARSCGVELKDLGSLKTDKGEWLMYKAMEKGRESVQIIPAVIETALGRLPIPKRMRWGDHGSEFVRPVHWVLVLLGDDPVPCEIMELTAGNITYGHRFHCPGEIHIGHPDEYLSKLEKQGKVLADFDKRKQKIVTMVNTAAESVGGQALIDDSLADEVCSLVEWPVVVVGEFDKKFLDLPDEVLITNMQSHQKYFPVVDAEGQLLAMFITIANIESETPEAIKKGNERVILPRLTDARFFWERDCATSLEDKIEGLKSVIFQQELGTLYEKTLRVSMLARFIGKVKSLDIELVNQAVMLSKCDLITHMVGEFPDLQGIMGGYYARASGVDEEIVLAIRDQYLPRQAGDQLPGSHLGQVMSIAERLDTISGIFSIGQMPTGDKDPFALRRAALGCLRVIIESGFDIDLYASLDYAAEQFSPDVKAAESVDAVFSFMMDRLKRYYLDEGVSPFVFDAVMDRRPVRPLDFHHRIQAVNTFSQLPEAEGLAAANKRISNILRQAGDVAYPEMDPSLLQEKAEQELAKVLDQTITEIQPLLDKNDYTSIMIRLAGMRDVVDRFFDEVMVMCDDEKIKFNRIALLGSLRQQFLIVADISRLQ